MESGQDFEGHTKIRAMLKKLFTSNTRIKLLTLFLMNPEEEYFIRELTRKLNEQINSVRRELDNLKKMGLLRSKTKNRKKYYLVNKNFPIFEELKGIFIKVLSSNQTIAQDLEEIGDIKVLALSGQFIDRPTTTVDMLIVGEINREKLTDYITNELRTKKPIKFTIMNEEDYKYRVNCKDQFIKEITTSAGNQVLINKFKDLS